MVISLLKKQLTNTLFILQTKGFLNYGEEISK